jgi:hypothetical protein
MRPRQRPSFSGFSLPWDLVANAGRIYPSLSAGNFRRPMGNLEEEREFEDLIADLWAGARYRRVPDFAITVRSTVFDSPTVVVRTG